MLKMTTFNISPPSWKHFIRPKNAIFQCFKRVRKNNQFTDDDQVSLTNSTILPNSFTPLSRAEDPPPPRMIPPSQFPMLFIWLRRSSFPHFQGWTHGVHSPGPKLTSKSMVLQMIISYLWFRFVWRESQPIGSTFFENITTCHGMILNRVVESLWWCSKPQSL